MKYPLKETFSSDSLFICFNYPLEMTGITILSGGDINHRYDLHKNSKALSPFKRARGLLKQTAHDKRRKKSIVHTRLFFKSLFTVRHLIYSILFVCFKITFKQNMFCHLTNIALIVKFIGIARRV